MTKWVDGKLWAKLVEPAGTDLTVIPGKANWFWIQGRFFKGANVRARSLEEAKHTAIEIQINAMREVLQKLEGPA